MQTIVIVLDSQKLVNPDLDLRYQVPDRIEELTEGAIADDGYDYVEEEESGACDLLAIWLETEDASRGWKTVLKILQEEIFLENNLSLSAKLYISENESAELKACTLVYDGIMTGREK